MKACFINHNIIKEDIIDKSYSTNLIGFSSDGASVMRGSKTGVATKLQQIYNNKLLTIHCLPHCFNLISSFASEAFHSIIEQMIKKIYNHFSNSAARNAKWHQFQVELNLKPYKIIRHATTRWLSGICYSAPFKPLE